MKKNLILLFLVIGLIILPLTLNKGAEFGGADAYAEEVIAEINPEYQPWFASIWVPPSGEVESLLFAVQAALGAGFIGYYIGYSRGKKNKEGKAKC